MTNVCLALAGCLIVAVAASNGGAQTNNLDEILARATVYVADFVTKFSNIVAEERYDQETSSPRRHRQLTSDFLLVKLTDTDEWITFRDVFAVDGKAVRDRDERLTKLFLEEPSHRALERARAITAEGARHNLVNIGTINNPLLAIAFLQRRYQGRFRFSLGRMDREDWCPCPQFVSVSLRGRAFLLGHRVRLV